ncbi:MAG: hypothetical protein M0032_09165 [Actinomycetota bacterium]|nr:hypothetical protein [Actinomycetota bacterium]
MRWWLLAFVGPGCDGCRACFEGLAAPGRGGLAADVGAVVVTRLPLTADERSCLARVDRGSGPVVAVVSDRAWADYRVSGYPFYVVVDGERGTVAAETVGLGWEDVTGTVRAALTADRDEPA